MVAFPLSFVNPLRPEQHHYRKTGRQSKLGKLLKWVKVYLQALLWGIGNPPASFEGSEGLAAPARGAGTLGGDLIFSISLVRAKSLMSSSVAV